MITLNDYLYSGDTLLRILKKYIRDLRTEAKEKHNEIDLVHCNFLIQIKELLEHNDFLTAQSQKIREFYKYMAGEYPFLAFTFKGRIKSLIRAEEKFNGYVVEFIYDYYKEYGEYPSVSQIKERSQMGKVNLSGLSYQIFTFTTTQKCLPSFFPATVIIIINFLFLSVITDQMRRSSILKN